VRVGERESLEDFKEFESKKGEIEKMIKNKGKERSTSMFFDLGIKECKS